MAYEYVTGMSGPPDSLFYTDTRGLQWDRAQGHWTRDDLSADLSMDRLHSGIPYMCTSWGIFFPFIAYTGPC